MFSRRFLLLLTVFVTASAAYSQTATAPTLGNGSIDNPYQVSSINHLYWITQNTTRWSLHYTQTANIDAATTSTWHAGAGLFPIGNSSVKFTGSYDGGNRTITGLTINRSGVNDVGLFGNTQSSSIRNVILVNVSIMGGQRVGALVGRADANTVLTNNQVTSGTVTGISAGGMVGEALNAVITRGSAKVTVTAPSGVSAIGGLVSQNINGTISQSYATGSVSGFGSTGGLVGFNNGGTVQDSYATGTVSGATAGGLVGLNFFVNSSLKGIVERSYAIGSVNGTTHEGSLVGRATASSVISNSYYNSGLSGLVGAVGDGSGTGATDLSSEQMRMKANFVGFDFTDIWSMVGDFAYFPTLLNNAHLPKPGSILTNGSGTSGSPYLIATVAELNAVRGYNSQYFRLVADIDLTEATSTGAGFIPINPSNNTIKFDGNGHAIRGMRMNTTAASTGFLGVLGLGGYVQDLRLTDVDITSSGSRVGGIAGSLNGASISNASVTGTITANNSESQVGGIVGAMIGPTSGTQASINRSWTDVELSGLSNYAGGIAGSVSSGKTITNAYALGSNQSSAILSAGIVGLNSGIITNTFAFMEVGNGRTSEGMGGIAGQNAGTITNSYWNETVSTRTQGAGQGTQTGMTSVSGAQMRQAATFTGYDFSTIWQSNSPNAFPTLRAVPQSPLPGYKRLLSDGSVSLDGVDDWIDLPDSIGIALGSGSDVTLEAWVKMDHLNQSDRNAGALFAINTSGGGNVLIIFITANLGGVVQVFDVSTYEISSEPLLNNEWIHVAYTAEGTVGKLFLNGELIGQHTRDAVFTPGNRWSFGQEFDNNARTNYSKLLADEIRVWNRARSQVEIRRDMYQTLKGDESGLVAYLPFEAVSGSTGEEASANTFGYSLQNGAAVVTDSHPFGTFITGNEGWRILSAPAGVSYGTLLEPLWTQGFAGSDSPNHGVANVRVYDEESRSFVAISDAADIPAAGTGFIVYVYDDTDFDGEENGFPIHLRANAAQRKGAVAPALTYTETGDEANRGWNLLGNPYAATIDWNTSAGWSNSRLDATFYVWNATAGAYQSWNGFAGTTALGHGLISPWQGFWVKANAASPSLTLYDDARSAGGILLKPSLTPQIRLSLSAGDMTSDAVVMLHDEASIDKDRFDAYKLMPLVAVGLSLSTLMSDGIALDINALPAGQTESVSVPIGLEGQVLDGDATLSWNLDALPQDWAFILRDTVTGTETDMRTVSEMAFTHRGEALKIEHEPQHGVVAPTVMRAKSAETRFLIDIHPSGFSTDIERTDLPSQLSLAQNYPNPFNPSTTIQFDLPMAGDVSLDVVDVLGRRVATLVNGSMGAGRHTVTFDARNVASGIYLYRLQAGGTQLTRRMMLIK